MLHGTNNGSNIIHITTTKVTTVTKNNQPTSNTSNSPTALLYFFGKFQQKTIGNIDVTIRTIFPPPINAELYDKLRCIMSVSLLLRPD